MFKYPSVFNWTATYRRDSTIVAPYEYWQYYNNKVRLKEFFNRISFWSEFLTNSQKAETQLYSVLLFLRRKNFKFSRKTTSE